MVCHMKLSMHYTINAGLLSQSLLSVKQFPFLPVVSTEAKTGQHIYSSYQLKYICTSYVEFFIQSNSS